MRKIFLVIALFICGIASAQAQTSGVNAPPPPVCSASNAGALYTQTSTSPNTVWTCSYYNLQYQWVVNPMYGGLVYYPIVPATCSGAVPVFLADYPNTTMYVCIQGVPTAVAGGGANITSLTGDATATGPGAATTTVTGINGAAIGASINVLSTNASKQVVGATYQNVVNLFGSGSCSGYLKSDGTCSTPSSIPSGTTNQLLYYAAAGNTVTPLTLGTNLSITGGTLNASGGTSSSVSVNGATVSNPNFNDTTPAPPTGYTNVSYQASGSDVSAYVPPGAGSALPVGSTIILAGSSWLNDDDAVLAPTLTISSYSCNGATNSVCTITLAAAPTVAFAAKDWVYFGTGGTFAPFFDPPSTSAEAKGASNLFSGGGYYQVLSTGLTSTTFEINLGATSSASCSSSCGEVQNAQDFQGPYFADLSTIAGRATVDWQMCDNGTNQYTLACYANSWTAYTNNLPDGTASAPVYFVMLNYVDDYAAGESASTIEGYLTTIWEDAHAKNWIVVEGINPWRAGAGGGNPVTAQNVTAWIRGQAKSLANQTTGDYWDYMVDYAQQMQPVSTFQAGNGGAEPAGVALVAADLARNLTLGVTNFSGSPAYIVDVSNYPVLYEGGTQQALGIANQSGTILGTWGGSGLTLNYLGGPPAGTSWCLDQSTGGLSTYVGSTHSPCPEYSQTTNSYTAPHFISSGTPTLSTGTGAGTSPFGNLAGNDEAGNILITTGTSPSASAPIATVTLGNTCSTGISPLIGAANAATAALSGTAAPYAQQLSASEWEIEANTTALAASTEYEWNYQTRCDAGLASATPLVQAAYAATTSASYSSSVTSGDLLVALFTGGGTNSSPSCSDTLGNTWTVDLNTSNTSGQPVNAVICSTITSSSGADTVTESGVASSYPTADVMEYQTASTPSFGVSGSVYSSTSGSISATPTLSSKSLVVAAIRTYCSGNTFTAGPSMTIVSNSNGGNPSYASERGNFAAGSPTISMSQNSCNDNLLVYSTFTY